MTVTVQAPPTEVVFSSFGGAANGTLSCATSTQSVSPHVVKGQLVEVGVDTTCTAAGKPLSTTGALVRQMVTEHVKVPVATAKKGASKQVKTRTVVRHVAVWHGGLKLVSKAKALALTGLVPTKVSMSNATVTITAAETETTAKKVLVSKRGAPKRYEVEYSSKHYSVDLTFRTVS